MGLNSGFINRLDKNWWDLETDLALNPQNVVYTAVRKFKDKGVAGTLLKQLVCEKYANVFFD